MTKKKGMEHQKNLCMDFVTNDKRKKVICRMDAAGKLFHTVTSPKIPCVYRLWATLKHEVRREALQKALENIMPRFPYYQVMVAKGFIWNKWRKVKQIPRVRPELEYPCQYIPIREKNTFPYRIINNSNQIIIEFNHSLTDGTGALIFLKSLVAEYLSLSGLTVTDWGDIFRPEQKVDFNEMEYAYRENFKIGIPKLPKIYKAFHLPFERMKIGISYVTNGKMNVHDILNLSKIYKVTLTEFLTAVYIDVLQEIMFETPTKRKRNKILPIRIMVPINVRNLLPSKTMRNFTTFLGPGVDSRLGKFSFEEIIEQVHHFKNMQVNEKYQIQQISFYVGIEINPFIGMIPNFIKRMFIRPLYKQMGESLFSAFLTNLGKINMPIEFKNEIIDFQVLPMYHPYFKSGCGLLTTYDSFSINFVRNIKENIVEEKFFDKLKKLGLEVQVTELFT
ncbi:MAG: hypothetical protein JXA54_04970 [Candidatus Heimdallarchaeota archaeon]|nr:hypothetical protein [Candidatus Heimdallarchaeota archaeon]